jgi:hypothetical protein
VKLLKGAAGMVAVSIEDQAKVDALGSKEGDGRMESHVAGEPEKGSEAESVDVVECGVDAFKAPPTDDSGNAADNISFWYALSDRRDGGRESWFENQPPGNADASASCVVLTELPPVP